MKISKLAAALTLGSVAVGGVLVPVRAEAAPADICIPGLGCVSVPSGPTIPGPTIPIPTIPIPVPTNPIPTNPIPTLPGLPGTGTGTGTGQVSANPAGSSQSGVSGSAKITGKPKVGKKLHADLSAYSAPGYTLSYQWLRNGKAIKVKGKHHKKRPATKDSYQLVGKDRGKTIVLQVTASKAGSQPVVSTATAPKIKK